MSGKAPLRAVWRKVAEGAPEQQAIIEYHHIGMPLPAEVDAMDIWKFMHYIFAS